MPRKTSGPWCVCLDSWWVKFVSLVASPAGGCGDNAALDVVRPSVWMEDDDVSAGAMICSGPGETQLGLCDRSKSATFLSIDSNSSALEGSRGPWDGARLVRPRSSSWISATASILVVSIVSLIFRNVLIPAGYKPMQISLPCHHFSAPFDVRYLIMLVRELGLLTWGTI